MNYVLFVSIMKKKKIYTYSIVVILVFFTWILSDSNDKKDDFPETVKIVLREVGNQLSLIHI